MHKTFTTIQTDQQQALAGSNRQHLDQMKSFLRRQSTAQSVTITAHILLDREQKSEET
jgi:hypothetical protein